MVSRTRRRVTSTNEAKAKASPWGDSSLSVSAESVTAEERELVGCEILRLPQPRNRQEPTKKIQFGAKRWARQLFPGCHGPQIREKHWQKDWKSPDVISVQFGETVRQNNVAHTHAHTPTRS
jgi:hypothetical protein